MLRQSFGGFQPEALFQAEPPEEQRNRAVGGNLE